MIELNALLVLFIAHWIADFICQSDWMDQNKSKSDKALLAHIGAYSLALFMVLFITSSLTSINQFGQTLITFVILNGLIHGIIDYGTSRWSSYLWNTKQVHWFFVVIGFDQMLHMITLASTYFWLFKG